MALNFNTFFGARMKNMNKIQLLVYAGNNEILLQHIHIFPHYTTIEANRYKKQMTDNNKKNNKRATTKYKLNKQEKYLL